MCLLTERLRPGDVAVDIGAHTGTFTKRFTTAVGPTGRVIACEPDEKTRERWIQNWGKTAQAEVQPYALSDTIGTRAFYQGSQSETHSLWASNVPKMNRTALVETTTLDALLDGVRPRVIKIDAQGAEAHILRGATETLQTPGLYLMLEIWPEGLRAAGDSVQAVADLLEQAGYVILAEGKEPKAVTRTWSEFVASVTGWTDHRHTNVIVAKAA